MTVRSDLRKEGRLPPPQDNREWEVIAGLDTAYSFVQVRIFGSVEAVLEEIRKHLRKDDYRLLLIRRLNEDVKG